MDAKQFLAEFGHIADAPGGIGKLRELILSLAFKGLLCPPSNETSASLLDEIERQRLDFNGETRKQRLTRQGNTTANSVAPYEIPKHWSWVSLSTVGHTWGQKKPLNSFNYIDVSSIDNKSGVVSHSSQVISASAAPSRARKVVKKGTLIYSTVRPYLLNIAIIDRDFEFEPIASTAFAIIHPWEGILGRYLYFYLRSPIFVMYVESVQTGMAYPAISDEKFYSGVVPLPPTEEQSRIVAKVDELMALCDKLDEQLQSRRTLQNALRQSTMQAIASATSPQELQINWTHLADNFGKLFHAPEDVSDLRKLVSELAIRGVLDTNHQPADTSSVDVYLAELGRKKSGKRFAKSVQPDEAFSLPNGWRWVLLEDLLSGSESGWSPKCEAEPRREGEWGVLKVSAVTWGAFDPNENKRLPLSLEARPECAVKPGDFMLSRANTAELVARSVIAPEDCPEKLLMSDKIVRLNFLDDALKPWVNLVNNSVFSRVYYKERATGTSDSMRNVSRQVIHELPIPLPSLKEQERILLALNRLLHHCDSLEKQAASRMELSTQLAASTISVFAGLTIEQQEEPMKAPQTELIAPLRLGAAPDIKAQAPLATILARHHGEMSAKDLWQRFGGEIDAFYTQLKTEVAHGWILEPTPAEVREKPAKAETA